MNKNIYSKNYLGTFQYHKLYKESYLESINQTEILYNLNSLGFRTDEFKKITNDTILYSGCSVTFGGELPEDHIWPYILNENINNKYPSYNLAYNAASIHAIIKNIFSFINNYGKPKFIMLCLPQYTRDIYYDNTLNGFINAIKYKKINYNLPDSLKNFSINRSDEDLLLHSITLISILEQYCNDTDIKLIWSTWFKDDEKIYKECGFNNFIEIDSIIKTNNGKKYKYFDIARDGDHFGASWHINTAEHFLNALKPFL